MSKTIIILGALFLFASGMLNGMDAGDTAGLDLLDTMIAEKKAKLDILNAQADEAYLEELARLQFASDVRLEKAYLELEAVDKHKDLFKDDAHKAKRVLGTLLACPSCNCLPSDRPIDQQLITAVTNGNESAVQAALQKRASANGYTDNDTVLNLALTRYDVLMSHNNTELIRGDDSLPRFGMVKLLLDHGANPNLPNHDSITPLHCAIRQCQIDLLNEMRPHYVLGSFAIVKLLVEHGARLKFAIFDAVVHESKARTTPLTNIQVLHEYNEKLIQFLLTHVYPEDELLGPDQESIVSEIIARTTLLLRMSPIHQNLVKAAVDSQNTTILDLLNADFVEKNYRAQIEENVKKMLSALAKPDVHVVSERDALKFD